jgi:transposase
MGAKGLPIRDDVPAAELRRLARREKDRAAAARMQAIAGALEGLSRAEAARLAGMERQALRDAVLRYDAEGLAGLHDRPRSGRRPRLDEEQRAARRGARWCWTDRTGRGGDGAERLDPGGAVPRGRGALGRVGSPRAHEQADAPPRPLPAEGAALAPEGGCDGTGGVRQGGLQAALDGARAEHADERLTLRFMDEARFGQKGRVCHRWSIRGQRPPGPCDQRYTWTHLFAAVRPATGDSFALVLPQVSTAAMNAFLAQFAATLAEHEHAVMVLDRAGWHRAKKLVIPSNVTVVWLPPYSPRLNPVERLWLFLRERHLSHRLLDTYDAVVAALCRAWNALTMERIRTLTSYPYLDQIKI